MKLGTKGSQVLFYGKSSSYVPVRIGGAENFKLNMKNANCHALAYAITASLLKPMSRERCLMY